MKELTQEEFREKQLNLLRNFHAFCEKHNLKYSLAFGTMLGAVRHGGFIPWDDDMDVAMLRPDYDRFVKIASSEPAPFAFYDWTNCRNIMFMFAKVVDPHACYKRVGQEGIQSATSTGVYLDVFPLDAMPRNKMLAKTYGLFIYFWRALLGSNCCYAYYKKFLKPVFSMKKRIAWHICKVLGCFVPVYPSWLLMNKIFHLFKCDKPTYVADMTCGKCHKKLYRSEWFDNMIKQKFDTAEFWMSGNYDAWLTEAYGDWRTPPSADMQNWEKHMVDGHICYDPELYMPFSK